jgi:shikimate kinase
VNHPASLGNIILIGFMGSGKSSIGRLLARLLGGRFVDTDQLIIKSAGCEIAEIFARDGEEHFRELETAALESLRGKIGLVIATGGGIVLRPENLKVLRELGFVVWLTASEDVIFARVSRNRKRPLLHTPNPRQTVSDLLTARKPLYEAAAQFTLDSSNLEHQTVAKRIQQETTRFFSSPSEPPASAQA